MQTNAAKNIDEYIAGFPENVQGLLFQVRNTVSKAAPLATEAIKYAIPTFVFHGNLVHFAAFKNHLGFYPGPGGLVPFEKELSKYKGGKGSVQFPLNEPLPLALISKIVKLRVAQNRVKASIKKK